MELVTVFWLAGAGTILRDDTLVAEEAGDVGVVVVKIVFEPQQDVVKRGRMRGYSQSGAEDDQAEQRGGRIDPCTRVGRQLCIRPPERQE